MARLPDLRLAAGVWTDAHDYLLLNDGVAIKIQVDKGILRVQEASSQPPNNDNEGDKIAASQVNNQGLSHPLAGQQTWIRAIGDEAVVILSEDLG